MTNVYHYHYFPHAFCKTDFLCTWIQSGISANSFFPTNCNLWCDNSHYQFLKKPNIRSIAVLKIYHQGINTYWHEVMGKQSKMGVKRSYCSFPPCSWLLSYNSTPWSVYSSYTTGTVIFQWVEFLTYQRTSHLVNIKCRGISVKQVSSSYHLR